jgi:CRISPR system Cascade subunit CasA
VFSFNLIYSKWIPCILPDGKREELSIKETFERVSDIQEIFDPSPLVTVAIHRLLLAILHRNFGPANETEWANLWNDGKGGWDKAKLMTYLDKWHSRFDLFDENYPFYQCASLTSTGIYNSEPISIRNLLHESAIYLGKATLFDHDTDDVVLGISPAKAARLLLAFQCFVLGGYSGLSKPRLKGEESAKAAPLTKGATCLMRGRNLFESLMLNLCAYNQKDEVPFHAEKDDKPAWEKDDETKPEDRNLNGYFDLLTWQSRRIRFLAEEDGKGKLTIRHVLIRKGNQFPDSYPLHDKEPMLTFLKAKQGNDPWPPLKFQEEKAIWRDSLILFQSVEDKSARPKILKWLNDLVGDNYLPASAIYNMDVVGLISDQASILLWRHERLPLPLYYLEEKNENLLGKLQDALDVAESVGKLLGSGFVEKEITDKKGKSKKQPVPVPLRILASNILKPDEPEKADKDAVRSFVDSLSPSRPYWAQLGISFNELVTKLPADKNGGNEYGKTVLPWWAKEIRRAACVAFEETINNFDRSARMLKAATLAENEFHTQLDKILKNIEKGGEKL